MTPERSTCSLAHTGNEELDMPAGFACPELQACGCLKERSEVAEQQPSPRAFAEVLLGHIRKRRLATHARQCVVSRLLRHAGSVRGRLGQCSGMTPER